MQGRLIKLEKDYRYRKEPPDWEAPFCFFPASNQNIAWSLIMNPLRLVAGRRDVSHT